ncbi:hypothetical protein FRB96_001812 [Tulasnella sp. 330]|nr:hypothetical protein FRB96_001812 [Tulasnella sp. 330]KAG8880311.1 hypothetical protein FRB97_000924 [Tulasnella sp. 331]
MDSDAKSSLKLTSPGTSKEALCRAQQQPLKTESLRNSPDPFQSLPVEVLTYILTLAAQSPSADESAKYIERQTSFPFTARGVCQLWRDITNSNPKIWTSAAIVTDPDWSHRLIKHAARCGTLPIHLDCIISTFGHFRQYAQRLITQPYIQDKTNIRSARVIGTPSDGVKYLVTIVFLARFSEALEELELVVRCMEDPWPGSESEMISRFLGRVLIRCPGIRSLTLRSFRPPCGPITYAKIPALEELYCQDCGPQTLQMIWYWDMPCLRTFVIDGISRAEETEPVVIRPQGTPLAKPLYRLPAVQVAILKGLSSESNLQILLSSIPNATALALTSPPESDPLSVQQGRMTSVMHLTIFEPAPDLGALRRFILFRLPALRVVELNERSRTEPNGPEVEDILLLKNQVDVHFLKEDELDVENVLVRMRRGLA